MSNVIQHNKMIPTLYTRRLLSEVLIGFKLGVMTFGG